MTTTNDALARARAALANITPGEWHVLTDSEYTSDDRRVSWPERVDAYAPGSPPVRVCEFSDETCNNEDANAAFIAAAPSLVRELCALAESQAAEIAELRAALGEMIAPGYGIPGGYKDDVFNSDRYNEDTGKNQFRVSCTYCTQAWWNDEPETHDNICPVAQARALLEADHEAE